MKKMRILALILTFIIVLTLAGCTSGSSSVPASSAEAAESTSTESASGVDLSKFPEKNITIVYYTKPGSGGDTFLRNLAAAVKDQLNGHSLVIENIVDPTGATAWGRVQKADPDGYTLAMLSSTVVSSDLIGGSPVKYEDFDYICGLGMDPQYVYCKADKPYKTLDELVEYCKEHPGEVNWGTAAPTSASTICSVQVLNKAGIDVNRVVYETGGDTFVALLGGFIDVAVGEFMDMKAQVEAGEIRLLSLIANERNMLDIPTAKESGYDLAFDRPRGLAAPLGTDPAIIQRLHDIFKTAYDNPEFMKFYEDNAIDAVWQSGDEFLESYRGIANTITENMEDIVGQQ